jgi:hypothetical protein
MFYAGLPVTEAARSKAWTVLTRSKAGIVCSNPTQGMDVCLWIGRNSVWNRTGYLPHNIQNQNYLSLVPRYILVFSAQIRTSRLVRCSRPFSQKRRTKQKIILFHWRLQCSVSCFENSIKSVHNLIYYKFSRVPFVAIWNYLYVATKYYLYFLL